jgi:hypothetical protein
VRDELRPPRLQRAIDVIYRPETELQTNVIERRHEEFRSGFVRSQTDIDKAVQVARGVPGVKSVKNDMRQVTADRVVAEGSLEISNEEDRDANQ